MPQTPHRVCLEGVDWPSLMPAVRLFRSFRMAIRPTKMFLALLLVLLAYLGGLGLDFVWGAQVRPGEFERSMTEPAADYQRWLEATGDPGTDAADAGGLPPRRAGIFETVVRAQTAAFSQLMVSATSLDFGLAALLRGQGLGSGGVLGALGIMVIGVPGWLYRTHPGFLLVYLAYAFVLTALIGGAISRVAAVEACREQSISALEAVRWVIRRYGWFVLAPLIPLGLCGLLGLGLAVVGLLFNFPVTEVLGGLLLGPVLLVGLLIAVILVGLAGAANLLFPAIAVEGTDAFDALSRAYNYVLGRPWRYLIYTAALIVYGAIGYLFVGVVVFAGLYLTKLFLGLWVVREVSEGVTRLDALLPDPRFGELNQSVQWPLLDASGTAAAGVVLVWVRLLIAVLPAFAVSYYFTAHTWVYLLLRLAADGTELEDVDAEPEPAAAPEPPEKLEPHPEPATAP